MKLTKRELVFVVNICFAASILPYRHSVTKTYSLRGLCYMKVYINVTPKRYKSVTYALPLHMRSDTNLRRPLYGFGLVRIKVYVKSKPKT